MTGDEAWGIFIDRLKTRGVGQWSFFWALLFFSGATILMTWPLVRHMTTSVIGSTPGDNWYYVWLIGWFQKSLSGPFQNPLVVPIHNYPYGWNLAYSEITLANVLIALPFSFISGPILGYNIALLLSFLFSGLVVYLWVESLTGSSSAAIISGTLFAFAPYRLAHTYGHLPLMGTQYLALHYFGLWHLLRQNEFTWKYSWMAGLGLGFAALSSMYYLYMTLIVSLAFILGFILIVERSAYLRRSFWKNIFSFALVSLPGVLIAIIPYLQLSLRGEANHRILEEVDLWSASISDFFLPAPTHFIWGEWVADLVTRPFWIEQTLYLGVIGLALSILSFVSIKRKTETSKLLSLLVLVIIVAALLSLGTTLHWFGERVTINIPSFLNQWISSDNLPIPLPQYFLFKCLPFYDGMRTWTRYGVYVILFFAVMAGIGYAKITNFLKRSSYTFLLLPLTALLIGIDYYIGPYPLSQVETRPVDSWLASRDGEGAFVQFPIDQSTQSDLIYSTLVHSKPFVGMFYGAYLPNNFAEIFPELNQFPDKGSIRLLKDRDVEYILVDSTAYQNWHQTQVQIRSLDLRQLAQIGDQFVYKLDSTFE